jgi:hypothetical protein
MGERRLEVGSGSPFALEFEGGPVVGGQFGVIHLQLGLTQSGDRLASCSGKSKQDRLPSMSLSTIKISIIGDVNHGVERI